MRAGIRTIILPAGNKRDLEEVDKEVKKKCKFIFAETVDQVLANALGKDAIKKVVQANSKSTSAKKVVN